MASHPAFVFRSSSTGELVRLETGLGHLDVSIAAGSAPGGGAAADTEPAVMPASRNGR